MGEALRDLDAICRATTDLELLELAEGRALRYARRLTVAMARLNRLRAELLVWKLTRRIDTCHSGNCKHPLLRRRIAMQRIERVERLASR